MYYSSATLTTKDTHMIIMQVEDVATVVLYLEVNERERLIATNLNSPCIIQFGDISTGYNQH